MDDADPALSGQRDRHRRLGHGVHRRREHRHLDRDAAGEAGPVETSFGRTPDSPGTSSTSSKVSPSLANFASSERRRSRSSRPSSSPSKDRAYHRPPTTTEAQPARTRSEQAIGNLELGCEWTSPLASSLSALRRALRLPPPRHPGRSPLRLVRCRRTRRARTKPRPCVVLTEVVTERRLRRASRGDSRPSSTRR